MPYDEERVVRDRLHRVLPAGELSGAGQPMAAAPAVVTRRAVMAPPEAPEGPRRTPPDGSEVVPVSSAQLDGEPSSRVLSGPGAFDPGRRGVRALALVAVLVVLGAGFWAWQSRPQVEPVESVAAVTPVAPSASVDPTEADGELVVAVAGKVRRPGLVRVPAGARVADAVQAAGGALPGVDVALFNPARKIADGELILIGVTAPPGVAPAGGETGVVPGGGKVNLNTATLAQLDTLPGVGPVLAQRILDHRAEHGGFRSVSDLRQVGGIGDTRYEQLKDLVTV
ncbi:ComEA family DNA-binding protein [Salinispora oceanensis]|uniref:ComEA family DNA-binding protein n=1 Tax=Salinispora oceanensis TaxID=1050199 RepID=UPI00036A440E|nr:ComEA family DNA-binding protein [Salinispora oceanensis]